MASKTKSHTIHDGKWLKAQNTALQHKDTNMSEEKKNKGGRPQREFDTTEFERLCHIQATEKEICYVLKTTDKTLSSWCERTYGYGFSETYKRHAAVGKISLRRWQWQAAKKGNTSMLIWLGKQVLGQKDNVEIEADVQTGVQIIDDIPDE